MSHHDTINILDMGSFYAGGHIVALEDLPEAVLTPVPGSTPVTIDPNGLFPTGHLYVNFMKLAEPRTDIPLLLWHGGGLTGSCWESTPDGRSGWQSAFLRSGYNVYVSDAVERGRAGWARYPEIFPGEPFFMPQHTAWELYRVGPPTGFSANPSERTPFKNNLFPAGDFDHFTRQIVPRWPGNEPTIQAAYDTYLSEVGPAILVAHSQGASFALEAAFKHPENILALVLIEPGGAPDTKSVDYSKIAGIPQLNVWGDFINEVPFWKNARAACRKMEAEISLLGGCVDILDFPKEGISGNSHLMMMDRNSDLIVSRIDAWLADTLHI